MILNKNFEIASHELATIFIRQLGPNIRRIGPKAALDDVKLDVPDLDLNGHDPIDLRKAAYDLAAAQAIELRFQETLSSD